MHPKITLALFNYCQAKYLPDSLNALLSQTEAPDEILLFDDASTDDSVELLKTIPNAKFHFNQSNLGIIANTLKAIEAAQCEYITFTAADDLLHPQFIAEHRKVLSSQPNLGLTCSDCVFFEDQFPRKHERYKLLPIDAPLILSPSQSVALFQKSAFTIVSACVYNRRLLQKLGGFKAELKSLSDFYLNAQIALRHPIAYIPQPLYAGRIVQNSYGDRVRKNRNERKKVYAHLFDLVYRQEPADFRNAFVKARLLSFGGLFLFYFIFLNPKYWTVFPPLLLKNWKFNLYKVFCMLLRRPCYKLPVKPIVAPWPR